MRSRLLVLAPLLVLLAHALIFHYTVDDAFISFRYARNLVDGQGLVYNPGERVEGYSNPSWVLLAAAAMRAGLDPIPAMRVVGILAAMGTILLVHRAAARPRRGAPVALLPAALLALNSAFALWSQAGLETTLFTFLVTGGVLAWGDARARERHTSRFPSWTLWFAAASCTRPEGPLFFALAALGFFLEDLSTRRRGGGMPRWRELSRDAAIFALMLLPFVLWRRHYYGSWLPNTYYAKAGGPFEFLHGIEYLGRATLAFGLLLLPFPLALLRQGGRREHLMPVTVIAGYLAYVIWTGGDGLAMFRFLVPVLPLLFLLTADALETLPVRARPHPAFAWAMLALFGAMSMAPTFVGPARDFVREDRERVYGHWTPIGEWLREFAKPGETIALTTAGAIPYYSGLRTIDMLGITDPHIAHRRMPSRGSGIAGHEKYDAEYILDRRPTYILHHEFLLTQPIIDRSQFDTPWNPGLRELADSPRFSRLYRPLSVRLGPTAYFSFFVLRREAGGPDIRQP